MKLSRITMALVAMCATLTAVASTTITVKNARDFIKALAPGNTIVIDTDKPLNITQALDEMIARGEIQEGPAFYDPRDEFETTSFITYYHNTDGNGLQVRTMSNLTIKAKNKKKGATLVASPRYVNVLEFIECDNLVLENITMGHTEGGYCDKGVLELDACMLVTINDCDFYGCGTEGFVFNNCNRITVNRSRVHDCTYHTMHVTGGNMIRFNDCVFTDNREFEQITIKYSSDIFFTGCVFNNLQGQLLNLDNYVSFLGCKFQQCELPSLEYSSNYFTTGNAIMCYCNFLNDGKCPKPGATKMTLKPGRWTDGANTYIVHKADDYRYVFENENGRDAFAIYCISADAGEYMTGNCFPRTNKLGNLSVNIVTQNKHDMVNILDDGHSLIKSFFYVGK